MRANTLVKRVALIAALMLSIFAIATTISFGASASGTGYVNSKVGAFVRSSPSTSSSKVAGLSNNTKLTINKEVFVTYSSTSSTNKWLYVSFKGKSGYIRSDLVDGISYSTVTGRTTDSLNYRVGAGTSMSRAGTFRNGTTLTVCLSAKAYNSSTPWYKIKYGSKYYYVCASWVKVTDTIFNKPDGGNTGGNTSGSTGGSGNSGGSGNTGSGTTDFEAYLTSQGFPEAYKVKLRELHAKHPNWVFIAKNTGVDWSTAVSKESRNGVSLVESVWPLSWRATDANSFKPGAGRTIYTSAGGSSVAGKLANNENFTILDEVWKGTTQWTHIKSANGITGYISGSITSQSYSGTINGKLTNDYVNIRKGAGTGSPVITTLKPYTPITVILQAKDSSGNVWYKIKYNNAYAYIISDYITISSTSTITTTEEHVTLSDKYPIATASAAIDFKEFPNEDFAKAGTISSGTQITVLGSVKDGNGKTWYKLYHNAKAVYALADNLTVEGTVTELQMPAEIKGTTTDALNYRKGAGISNSVVGTFKNGTVVSVIGGEVSGNTLWYKINLSGQTVYSSSEWINLSAETAPVNAAPTIETETVTKDVPAKPADLRGTGYIMEGTYIPKDGSNWFNANSQTVAYYMDPRNFLNEDRVYMFEDLSYHGEYQTQDVVNKVLSGTKLATYGFQPRWFVSAGAKYNMSPVALAARARQETGGGSIAISGYVYNGRTVYNPFNIGATSSSNPVMNGIVYAYNKGWYTKEASINGGAQFIASGYISKGQNSLYYQRFNVANGVNNVGTHQYMTNLLAPYSESLTVKNTYTSYGIVNEALTFVIPIYNNMPASTSLPG